MAYKILAAEQRGPFYCFSVHLDETKPLKPEWIKEWCWSVNPPPVPAYPEDHEGDRISAPMTPTEYQQAILSMIGENVRNELAAMGEATHAPVALDFFLEGTD